MKKIQYKSNYIKTLLDDLMRAGFIFTKEPETVRVLTTDGKIPKVIFKNISPLTYQLDEQTKEILIFDPRM